MCEGGEIRRSVGRVIFVLAVSSLACASCSAGELKPVEQARGSVQETVFLAIREKSSWQATTNISLVSKFLIGTYTYRNERRKVFSRSREGKGLRVRDHVFPPGLEEPGTVQDLLPGLTSFSILSSFCLWIVYLKFYARSNRT
jgi:hypothetical protein